MDDVDPAAHVALALDVAELDAAKRLIEATRADVGVFKVGLELFTAAGPAAVEAVTASGAKCFLDLKLHDIPETMGRAVAAASSMGATYLTVHAAAGPESLIAARQRAGAMLLLAVTVLTSLDDAALRTIGLMDGARNTVGAGVQDPSSTLRRRRVPGDPWNPTGRLRKGRSKEGDDAGQSN
jgi:orotidine 5'-phosphate decarboxylase subfamily 1